MAPLAEPDEGHTIGTNAATHARLSAHEADEVEFPESANRRWRWPTILFLLTVLSTIWVGICGWSPLSVIELCLANGSFMPLRQAILANWMSGLLYSFFLLAILMAHELGHYFVARWYRVPATPPIFLPFPINSIGTMGAVIAMRGHEANRRQIFDIGIAGPLAGLVLAFPIALLGTWQLDLSLPRGGGLGFEIPLAMRWMISLLHPDYHGQAIWLSQLNPAFTAAWVALLVTGLNMMPVSQLDGGHVTYGLFVRRAHVISYSLLIFAIAYMVYQQILIMVLMVVLLLLMGPTHPPTSDDSVKLGWPRTALGLASLCIPILCFPPNVFKFNF
jgi:Zn-dependent protease